MFGNLKTPNQELSNIIVIRSSPILFQTVQRNFEPVIT